MKTQKKNGVASTPQKKSQSEEQIVLTKSEYEKLLALANGKSKKKEWVVIKTLKPIPTSNATALIFALAKWGDEEYISVAKEVKGKIVSRHAYPLSVVVKAIKELI